MPSWQAHLQGGHQLCEHGIQVREQVVQEAVTQLGVCSGKSNKGARTGMGTRMRLEHGNTSAGLADRGAANFMTTRHGRTHRPGRPA